MAENFPNQNWHYDLNEIDAERTEKRNKRLKIRIRTRFGYDGFFIETIRIAKRSRFGSAEFFRQFKRKKRKGFTRIEPPSLVQSNPFQNTSYENYQPTRYTIAQKPPKYDVSDLA